MMPAVFDQTVIEIDAGRVGLRATGQVMRFAGYLAMYAEAQDDASPDDESAGSLPDIHQDETLRLLGCQPEQHFTQPPRFSEATLVRELEEKGIGRPSTYIKWGRNGYFLVCSGFPECRNIKEYTRNADGTLTVQSATRPSDQICPSCSSPMVIRRGRFGEFLACSRYPDCKTTSAISLGVACPRPGCGGYLTEKRSRRGKIFFGCSNYAKTKCD